ncbi:ribosome biogenesis regulatory protein [Culex quinquefasciatus]|uniref:Ribosome biogenesis regulatory protein n=1 Tax=Culex quinquefasciatus TaxID=7176 RepID=B0WTY3_CULQU|nr:ribosome biogenesis regulatory protein [Culex quinquefasciatus]|eukprot:XP_001856788.1 ribosome biogenesis regulatory protein [Culex quinquefasciatus]
MRLQWQILEEIHPTLFRNRLKNPRATGRKEEVAASGSERVPPVLMDSTRDNTQMLINAVCELLTERDEEAVGAKMHVRRQFYPVPGAPAPKPLTFFF